MPEIVDNFLKAPDLKPFGSSKEAKVTKISPVVPLGFFVDIFILLTSDWLIEMLTFWLIQVDWLLDFSLQNWSDQIRPD